MALSHNLGKRFLWVGMQAVSIELCKSTLIGSDDCVRITTRFLGRRLLRVALPSIVHLTSLYL